MILYCPICSKTVNTNSSIFTKNSVVSHEFSCELCGMTLASKDSPINPTPLLSKVLRL